MTAKHFVVWTDGDRTHLASRSAYRRGEAAWRMDERYTVPEELVDARGGWEWQTPINGPFPAFPAARLTLIVEWLIDNGCTVRVLEEPPA